MKAYGSDGPVAAPEYWREKADGQSEAVRRTTASASAANEAKVRMRDASERTVGFIERTTVA